MKCVLSFLFVIIFVQGTGCVIPQFVNPLSKKGDSVIDKRLIGHWESVEIDKNGVQTRSEPDDVFGQYIVVGRHSENKDAMIVAQTKLAADGTVAHESRIAIATRLDNEYYITWELQPQERDPADRPLSTNTTYTITTYTLQNNDTLLAMFMLDHEHIIKAVKEGRLASVIEEEVVIRKGKEMTEIQSVIIESTTAELREYFTKFGSVTFNRREPSYYRKVVK
jgi:hypothetical protein